MKYTIYIFILLIASLLLSCSHKSAKDIVGKWKAANTGEIYEFQENGDVKVLENYGMVTGKYYISKSDKIDIIFSQGDNSAVKVPIYQADYDVDKDNLTFTYQESVTTIKLELERVR